MRESIFAVLGILISACLSFAGPIGTQSLDGTQLYGTGGEVIIYFWSSDAEFDSQLWLDLSTVLAGGADIGPIFHNHESSRGAMVSLGIIPAHTPLPFRLQVITEPNNWYLGPAASNADGLVHARVGRWEADEIIPRNGFLVGFEDWPGQSDFDYNDFEFVVYGVTDHIAPEPATFALMGVALAGLGLARFRR